MIERLKENNQLSFKEKFANPETIEFNEFPRGGVEVVDLEPQERKVDTPLMIVPGWSLTASSYQENAEIFSGELGRRTVTVTSPHGIDTKKQSDIPLAELRKSAAINSIIDKKEFEKVDVVTHSEGALFVTVAALQNPERFRNIVYFAPAGLIGDDSFWQLAKRFASDMLKQNKELKEDPERKPRTIRALLDFVKTLKNPKKSLDEVRAIADMQIQENLKELKKKGVGITIIHPVGDKAFPMERMQEMVNTEMIDGFLSVGGPSVSDTHNAWFLSPRQYTKAVDEVLTIMEKKKEKAS